MTVANENAVEEITVMGHISEIRRFIGSLIITMEELDGLGLKDDVCEEKVGLQHILLQELEGVGKDLQSLDERLGAFRRMMR